MLALNAMLALSILACGTALLTSSYAAISDRASPGQTQQPEHDTRGQKPRSGGDQAPLAVGSHGYGLYDTSVDGSDNTRSSPSDTPDGRYGSYNYCNMPHVRTKEYIVPPKEFELVYVEVIQRHHKRTPYSSNIFFQEDIPWECEDEGPYVHARSNGFKTAQVYWQVQRGTLNPFERTIGPGFVGSNCVFPAITARHADSEWIGRMARGADERQGLDDAKQHGEDLRAVYGDLLGFLPESTEKEQYAFRVTNNAITSQTLGGLLKGLYPDIEEYAALVQPESFDSLEPSFSCPAASAIKDAQTRSRAWEEHLASSDDLRARFNAVSGIEEDDTAGWRTSWDHPFDNLSSKQCHAKPLPCSVNDSSVCLTQDDAEAIYRLGHWEYAYRYKYHAGAKRLSALKMGPWFVEMLGHVRQAIDGSSPVKYFHNFAHDGSIAPLLGLLQARQMMWPGMGSEIIFELWSRDHAHHIRVLFSGRPVQTDSPLGVLDMIPLEDFTTYFEGVVSGDAVAACAA